MESKGRHTIETIGEEQLNDYFWCHRATSRGAFSFNFFFRSFFLKRQHQDFPNINYSTSMQLRRSVGRRVGEESVLREDKIREKFLSFFLSPELHCTYRMSKSRFQTLALLSTYLQLSLIFFPSLSNFSTSEQEAKIFHVTRCKLLYYMIWSPKRRIKCFESSAPLFIRDTI